MPIYAYKCPSCGEKRDIVKPIAALDRRERCLSCPGVMDRQVVAPMIRPDYAAYDCPITGERIEGRKAHEANLRKHGCRVLEPGESASAAAAGQAKEEAFFDSVGETAARIVANMPQEKQERLANELDAGIGLGVERSTPTTI